MFTNVTRYSEVQRSEIDDSIWTGQEKKLLNWTVAVRLRRTIRKPRAADRREIRSGREEIRVQKLIKYGGAEPTRELRMKVRILSWMS